MKKQFIGTVLLT